MASFLKIPGAVIARILVEVDPGRVKPLRGKGLAEPSGSFDTAPSTRRTSSARTRCSKPARLAARSCWRGFDQFHHRVHGALRLFDRIN